MSEQDERVLAGASGEAARFAMSIICEYGSAIGAARLISITRAHIDGCLYHGPSGLDFVERLLQGGAAVCVPTTLNVGAVDLIHPELNRGDRQTIEYGRRLMSAYERMGCQPTWTCAPFQLPNRPTFGEQVAWAESNAIAFINSVVGARTDRYGDLIDICAAITGRVPERGLHLTENRRGEVVFDVRKVQTQWSSVEVFWPLLGIVIGSRTGNRIPVIMGVRNQPSEDDLKALGAAAASSGAVALFHVVGVTPEARTIESALQDQAPTDVIEVTAAMLREAQAKLTTSETGKLVAISVGTPHFSLPEFERLLKLICGKTRNPGVEFYVSTSRYIIGELERRGWTEPLQQFGVELVADTCTYLKPIIRRQHGLIMTNSAKWAYYAPGNLGYKVIFTSLADCVASAVAGRVTRDSASNDG